LWCYLYCLRIMRQEARTEAIIEAVYEIIE
jgi:hypothetical protein